MCYLGEQKAWSYQRAPRSGTLTWACPSTKTTTKTKKKKQFPKNFQMRSKKWEQTVSYPTSERETVEELQQAHGQLGSHHMLQVDLVACEHSIRIFGAPININPVINNGYTVNKRSFIISKKQGTEVHSGSPHLLWLFHQILLILPQIIRPLFLHGE